ncbi:MAG: tetratricopeptide repeat protein [Candidatus Cyclobacteriaceae bacterium M3_2C_046]
MKTKSLFAFIAFTVIVNAAFAQSASEWNWPEDKASAEERYVLYKDALKQDNYTVAKKPHLWLLKNVPDLHNSLYIDGAKIYEGLAEIEDDAQKTLELQDSALTMYDLRIKYFNDEANVLNRKAYTAYKYWSNRQAKYPELFEIYDKTFTMNGNKVASYIIVPYMDVVRRYKLATKKLNDEEVIEIYDKVNEIIDSKQSSEKTETIKENVDKIFMATVNVDCNFITNNMGPKFRENPDNLDQAKKIMQLMYAGKCTDDPLFLETVKAIFEKEPEYGLAYLIGIKSIQNEEFEVAGEYLKQAIEMTEDNSKKADIFMKLGDMENMNADKVGARSYYRQAVNADPTQKEAYEKIGDLYFHSFEQCKGGENIVKDRAVYLAAYEMYRRAGASQKMAQAKSQFPSKEEAFTYDMYAGDQLTVGCWIGETVTLATRD